MLYLGETCTALYCCCAFNVPSEIGRGESGSGTSLRNEIAGLLLPPRVLYRQQPSQDDERYPHCTLGYVLCCGMWYSVYPPVGLRRYGAVEILQSAGHLVSLPGLVVFAGLVRRLKNVFQLEQGGIQQSERGVLLVLMGRVAMRTSECVQSIPREFAP